MFLSLKSAEGPCSNPWSYASSIPFPSRKKLFMLAFKESLDSKFALPHFKLIPALSLRSSYQGNRYRRKEVMRLHAQAHCDHWMRSLWNNCGVSSAKNRQNRADRSTWRRGVTRVFSVRPTLRVQSCRAEP